MNKTESHTIHTTTNYNQFSTITGNRAINIKKVDRIKADISSGLNLLPLCPIIVYKSGKELMIVDGQHRFEVSKTIGHPVHYVVAPELDLKQIALLNSRQDKWSSNDFLKCYIKLGIDDYQTLSDVMKRYCMGLSITIDLLMSGKRQNKGDNGQKFRDGLFKVNHYDATVALYALSHSIFDMYSFYNDRNLIAAVQAIQEKGLCDFNKLREKVKAHRMHMDKQSTVKDYIFNIERVYNMGNVNRQIIF